VGLVPGEVGDLVVEGDEDVHRAEEGHALSVLQLRELQGAVEDLQLRNLLADA
jgi:hypothetical protein